MTTIAVESSRFERLPVVYHRFRELTPPIIIIGMHRSGTSLVSGMLTHLGVYMDPVLEVARRLSFLSPPDELHRSTGYGEAVDFRLTNQRIMIRAGGDWNDVQPFLQVRDSPWFASTSQAYFQAMSFGRLRTGFLSEMASGYRGPWGWKDPRTSLTLPIWLRLFPEAKILHVRREPEAIAASLLRRQSLAPDVTTPSFDRIRRAIRHPEVAARYAARKARVLPPRQHETTPLDKDGYLKLAQAYVEECLRHSNRAEHYTEVWYEEILNDPACAAEILAEFAGVSPLPATLRLAAEFVQPAIR